MKKRDEQRMAGKEVLVQDGPRPRKGRFQERSNEAAPEAAAEGWVASATMLEGGVVTAEPVEEEAADDDQQLCVVESIEVIHPVSPLPLHAAVQPYILEGTTHPGCNRMHHR